MNVEQRQAAADRQTKRADLGCGSASRLLLSASTTVILLLLNPIADTYFTVAARRV